MTKVVIPTDADELKEMLNDNNVIKQVYNQGDLGAFIKNYVEATNKKDPDLLAQVKEETERVLVNWLAENEAEHVRSLNLSPYGAKPKMELGSQQGTKYNPKAAGAQVDKLFDGLGQYFFELTDKGLPTTERAERRNKLENVMNALGSTVPSDGGFLIPEVMRSMLLKLSLETAIVRPRARVIPMDSLRVPIPTIDETSHATSIYGGMIAYWAEEGATLTETSPKFGRVVLEAKKLTGYTEVPQELLSDSLISLEAFIGETFPEMLAWFEDISFFEGGGVGEPLGFLNAASAISVTRAGANNVAWADIVAMYARMIPSSLNRAVWVVSNEVLPELLTMEISTGSPAVWVNHQLSSAPTMSMLGRPLIVTEKASQLGVAGDVNFVDFGFYLIGDRQTMQARQSEHYRFKNDEVAFRITQRLDGRPWLQSAITPRNSGDTLSPFVKIAA